MLPDTRQRLEEALRELQGLVVGFASVTVRDWPSHSSRVAGAKSWEEEGARAPANRLPPSFRRPLQDEFGGSLEGSEELAQAEEQVAAVQPLVA